MTRYRDIDLLKTIAIFGVLIIHDCSKGFSYPVASFIWTYTLLWGTIVRASVPIFFMCSGVLLLTPSKELPIKKLFSNNILRILAAMFFWSFLYELFHLFVAGTLSPETVMEAIGHVILFKQEFHFYYLHIILLFYVLLPIVRVYTKYASKKELQYGLLVWLVVGILYPTVRVFWPFNMLSGIPSQWLLNMTYASVGYGLLGYYLKKYGISIWASILASISGLSIVFGGTFIMSVYQQTLFQGFLEGMSIGTALLATGVFGLCMHWGNHLSSALTRAVTYVSKASFCIYLVHMFFVYILYSFKTNALIVSPITSIPIVAVLTMILCCITYTVLARIPFVKRWLI